MSISDLLITHPLVVSWLIYAVVGRILIFVWQKFPAKYVPTAFIKDIHACDLCSGTYLYPVLAWVMGMNFISGILLGVVTSYIVWIFVKGVKATIAPETLIIK